MHLRAVLITILGTIPSTILGTILGTVFGTALALGCGGPPLRGEGDLSESVRRFNDGVRWERFAAAAVALPPRDRSQFVEDMDQRAADLKITDYEIVRVDPRGANQAQVQIKLTWYRTAEGTVHETHAVQLWEHHGTAWWMVEETRLRGAEMPGLAEAPDRLNGEEGVAPTHGGPPARRGSR